LLLVAASCLGCHLIYPFAVQQREGGPPDAGPDGAVDAAPDTRADASSDLPPDAPRDTPALPDGPPVDQAAPDAGWSPPGTWVTIKAGTYTMGSPKPEPCRQADEIQHQVTLTRSFRIQTTEVTQQQYKAMLAYNPATYPSCGMTCAVEGVTWHMAAAYCNELSKRSKLAPCYGCSGAQKSVTCATSTAYGGQKIYGCPGYRLPTEAEWEYAYRAGTKTAYHNGANSSAACEDCTVLDANAGLIAWYCANKGAYGSVKKVAGKKANAWGLYDMAGNLWEWCHDYSLTHTTAAATDPAGSDTGAKRIVRGGSWWDQARHLRAAHREGLNTTSGGGTNGFRCVRSLTP
jgi:formylglycine-generating enzyme required for sulfatase activity